MTLNLYPLKDPFPFSFMSHNPTLLNPAEHYIRSLQSKTGRVTMSSTLDRVAQILGGKDHHDYDWSTINIDTVEYIKSELIEQDLSPATINKYLAALRGVAKQAWLTGVITHEAYLHINMVKKARGSRLQAGRALTSTEVFNFYKNIDNETLSGKRDLAMFSLLVECGMRRADIHTLNCGDINWNNCAITYRAKGNKERTSYLTKQVFKLLGDYFNHHPFRSHPDNPLFIPIRRGGKAANVRLNERSINRILNKHRILTGIKSFSPHDLRRTFATHLFDQGVDVKMVQDAMGHAQISTTVKYDRRNEERTKELMREFQYFDDEDG